MVPRSLFTGLDSDPICTDYRVSLWCRWGWQSFTWSQSTGWWHSQACSASAKFAQSSDSTARQCSLRRWLSSSVVYKDSEVRHVRRVLGMNGYPWRVVKRYSDTTRAAHRDSQMTRDPPITLPYVWVVSEAARRILTTLDVRVTFKPNITLKQLLVRPKDQTPDRERANVVYQDCCANCPATYMDRQEGNSTSVWESTAEQNQETVQNWHWMNMPGDAIALSTGTT